MRLLSSRHARPRASRPDIRVAAGLLAALLPAGVLAGQADAPAVTITRPARPPFPPQVPPPIAVTPGVPLPLSEASILDGETRFRTPGPAQARCPGQEVVFVFGVVDPLRPTAPGDGAFMCRPDAVAQGYLSR